MNALSATIQALLADATIVSLVGQRVEPVTAPEGMTMPDIVVNQVTNSDPALLGGHACLPSARVRIECRAMTKTEVLTIGDAVDSRLMGLSGSFAGMTVYSFIKGDTDATDSEENFSIYRRIIDYDVRYRPA